MVIEGLVKAKRAHYTHCNKIIDYELIKELHESDDKWNGSIKNTCSSFSPYKSNGLIPLWYPLYYIKDFLGHESLDTTSIYAEADLEIMRSALEKVNENGITTEKPVWENNEDMILRLCGLK